MIIQFLFITQSLYVIAKNGLGLGTCYSIHLYTVTTCFRCLFDDIFPGISSDFLVFGGKWAANKQSKQASLEFLHSNANVSYSL